jgi:tetratricopeptide (TPR) repeat protein
MPVKATATLRKAMVYWQARWRTLAEACALAAEQHRLGNFQAAADIYGLVLTKAPDQAEIHNNRGTVLQLLKQYKEALESYDRAIALKPDYANAHFNRGLALKNLNRSDEALASYDRALALIPDNAEIHNSRGVLLQQMRRYDEAIDSYNRAIAAKPDHVLAHYNRGTVLLSQGNMAEAEKMFRKALALRPDFPGAWHSLAKMRHYQNPGDEEATQIRTLLDQPNISPEDREYLSFALGKIYDDCGRYDEAFEYFREANRIRNTFVSYQPEAVAKMTDDLIDVFNRDFLVQRRTFVSDSATPVLIVGMPRSGTTLLAQMLGNHPAIAIAGELKILDEFASDPRQLPGTVSAYPLAAKHLSPETVSRMASEYEKRLRRDVGDKGQYIIDKNPVNFKHLGFLSLLFSRARVIHCMRNPLDTCLSNYFQRFPLSLDYSFDLRNIGHFYREYYRLMEHWRKVVPLPFIEVNYEDAVLDTEKTVRRVLDFLELEWDDHCLTPHTNPNPVETASEWQVRQPIYHHSVGHWRHYEAHLAPLKEMLSQLGI